MKPFLERTRKKMKGKGGKERERNGKVEKESNARRIAILHSAVRLAKQIAEGTSGVCGHQAEETGSDEV